MPSRKTTTLVATGAVLLMVTLYGTFVLKSPLFVAIYDRFLAGFLGVGLLIGLPALAIILWQRRGFRSLDPPHPDPDTCARDPRGNRDRKSIAMRIVFGSIIVALLAPSVLTYLFARGVLLVQAPRDDGLIECTYLVGFSTASVASVDVAVASGEIRRLLNAAKGLLDDDKLYAGLRRLDCPTVAKQAHLVRLIAQPNYVPPN